MATQTLAEAQKLINNQIVAGVAQDIISINPLYDLLPFTPYEGQALLVNRENALGDAGFYAVDATITHKTPATFTQVPFTATKIIGDAEMDGLVQAQSMSAGVDQMAVEISSKAKSVGRQFQTGMATGTGVIPQMNSLHSLCDSGQYTTASAGQAISFALLDELLDLVKAKDGQVDWIMMPSRTLRAYKVLCRALSGNSLNDVRTLDSGRIVAEEWPETKDTVNAVRIRYTAGWSAATVPVTIKHWLLIRVATMYEHREALSMVSNQRMVESIPRNFVDGLLDQYTVLGGL